VRSRGSTRATRLSRRTGASASNITDAFGDLAIAWFDPRNKTFAAYRRERIK